MESVGNQVESAVGIRWRLESMQRHGIIEWADAIFGQNEVLNTPQVPPIVVSGGVRWAIVVAS